MARKRTGWVLLTAIIGFMLIVLGLPRPSDSDWKNTSAGNDVVISSAEINAVGFAFVQQLRKKTSDFLWKQGVDFFGIHTVPSFHSSHSMKRQIISAKRHTLLFTWICSYFNQSKYKDINTSMQII